MNRPEHRSVLEWLNESGPKDVKFFAIGPRVVSIEGSESHGFEFEVVVEPNDWKRELTDEESLTETEKRYKKFFGELVEAYAERRPSWYKLTPGRRGYMTFSAGISGVSFGWVFHQGPEFSVELYISTSEKVRNEAMFEALQDARTEIESNLDVELVWHDFPTNRRVGSSGPRRSTGKSPS